LRAQAGRAGKFWSSGQAQNVTALGDLTPGLRRLASALARKYPEAARIQSDFITARQTGQVPRGASAAELAQRGLPTRERFADPITGAQAEAQFGTTFGAGKKNPLPAGQGERLGDALERVYLLKDKRHHDIARSGVRTVEGIVKRAEEQARDSYAKAYAAHAGMSLRRTVSDVFSRHLARASLQESTATEAYLLKARKLFLRPQRSIDLRQFDQVKRELDGMIRDDLAKPKYVHRGGVLAALQRDLLDAVDSATGGLASPYKAARDLFSSEMALTDAYLLGRASLGDKAVRLRRTGPGQQITGTEITADTFNALETAGEQMLFRIGLMDAIRARPQTISVARSNLEIFDSPRVSQLIRVTVPRGKTKSGTYSDRHLRFGDYVEAERAMIETRDQVKGNSLTAQRIQDDLALGGLETVQAMQTFTDMWRGSSGLLNFGMKLLEWIVDRSFGIGNDRAAALSRMLFTANPAEQEAILGRLAAMHPAGRMARFNELMRRAQSYGVQPGIGTAAGTMGAPTPDAGGPVQL
jgi:hypothetical protein